MLNVSLLSSEENTKIWILLFLLPMRDCNLKSINNSQGSPDYHFNCNIHEKTVVFTREPRTKTTSVVINLRIVGCHESNRGTFTHNNISYA